MLNSLARSSVTKVTDPIGRGLLKAGMSPDLVTVIGTVGVVAGSVALLAPGLPVLGLHGGHAVRARRPGRRRDGQGPRVRDGLRGGAGRLLRPDRRRCAVRRARVLRVLLRSEMARHRHADLPGHRPGDLLRQGAGGLGRADHRRRPGRTGRAQRARAGRRRPGRARRAARAGCLPVGVGGGRPGHRGPATGPGPPGRGQGGRRHRPTGAPDARRCERHRRIGSPTSDSGQAGRWPRTLPDPVADRIFRQAADTAFRRRGPSVVQLAKNLHRVLGGSVDPASLSAVVQAGMRSYARYWKETFRLPAMDHDEVFEQVEAADDRRRAHRPGPRAGQGRHAGWSPTPATGMWPGCGSPAAGATMTTVVERLKPESLYEKFVAYRESLGMEILPLTGGAPSVPGAPRAADRAAGSSRWSATATCPPAGSR